MSLNLLEDAAKNLVSSFIPPVQRYFTYFFIIIGVLWLGGANYYYYAEECTKFKGALITSFIFFILASATALWEYYMKRERAKKNNFNEIALKVLPLFMPVLLNILKNVILSPRLIKFLAIVGLVFSGFYYTMHKKDNKFDS